MSGTYRTTVVYIRDGHYSHGVNARNGAAEMKKIDRRAKRRQAAKITREALREHDESEAIAVQEMMDLMADYELYDCVDYDDDFNDDYWDGDYGNQPGDDDFNDYYVRDYYDWDDYDDFDFREELKCPAEKQAVQEGVSLGDILARICKEKEMA